MSLRLTASAHTTHNGRMVQRVIYARYGIAAADLLNAGPALPVTQPDSSLAAALYQAMKSMQAEAFRGDGSVDYARLSRSQAYAEYREKTRSLQSFDPATLVSREERLAFWINLYNALVVDGVIRLGVQRSPSEIPGFFWRVAYNVGGRRYDSTDIENGILRANRSHPVIPVPQFGASDERRRYMVDPMDVRVHFALVCAARSCPPVAFYAAQRIDLQLDMAARAFINGGGVHVDRATNRVALSRIFQWYAPDFGGAPLALGDKRPLLRFIAPYMEDADDGDYLLRGNAKVSFQEYDWTLNRA